MLVKKTIIGGLNVYGGDLIVSENMYVETAYIDNLEVSNTSILNGKLTVTIGGADITGAVNITGLLTGVSGGFAFNDGTSEVTFQNGIFYINQLAGNATMRFTDTEGLYIYGTNGNIRVGEKASVGDENHANYQFYVKDKAVTGNIALFKSSFAGAAVVTIDAASGRESQLRFYEDGVFKWQVGNDEPSGVFSISNTEGEFSTSTDVVKFGGSSSYIYGATTLTTYLTARTSDLSFVLSAGANDKDVNIIFRQITTSKYIMGYDDSSDSFKVEIGSAFSLTPAIEITSTNDVHILNLGQSGVTMNVDGNIKLSSAGPGTGGHIDLTNSFGSINNEVVTYTDNAVHTLLSSVYTGAIFLLFYAEDHFPNATNTRGAKMVTVMDDDVSGDVHVVSEDLMTPIAGGVITVSYANATPTSCDMTVQCSSNLPIKYGILRIA